MVVYLVDVRHVLQPYSRAKKTIAGVNASSPEPRHRRHSSFKVAICS